MAAHKLTLYLHSFIKYTANVKVDSEGNLKASRCNCTYCQKLGYINASLDGPADFKLLSPKSPTDDGVGNYTRHSTANKWFCKNCGMHVYAEGQYEFQGQKFDFFTVNIASVDQPQDGVDLSTVKFSYWDGLHDNWMAGEKDTPYPNGLP